MLEPTTRAIGSPIRGIGSSLHRRARLVDEFKGTLTASVIGSGPNGLSAAIVLAAAGLATTVLNVMLKSGERVPPQRSHCRISVRI